MEQIVGALMSVAIFFAIVYAIARTVGRTIIDPLHAKLDRILEQQERLLLRAPTEIAQ